MTIIGLTGGFGTGKSFVASIFRRLGASIVDADKISKRAIRRGAPAYKKIVAKFGDGILRKSGEIDRRKLASIVFGHRPSLERLNRIVHPEVIRSIKRSIRTAGKGQVVLVDAPLLVEAKLTGIVDYILVVTSSRKTQINRCKKKFHIKEREILDRMKNQVSMKKKIRLSDFVIDNDGSRSETVRQAKKIWKEIVWK